MKDKLELTLDNRQIAGTFVGGLLALGAVFVLGVSVGKRLPREGVTDEAPADVLSALDQRAARLEEVRTDAATLTFQDELTRQRLPDPAPVEPAKTVVVQPVAAEPGPVAAPLVEKVAGRLADTPVATRTASGDAALKEALARATQRKVPEVSAGGNFTLQLAASQSRAEAERFAGNLREKGYAPFIVEAHVPGKGTFFRVRMGRFPSKDGAQRYLQDFKRETSLDAFVAPVD